MLRWNSKKLKKVFFKTRAERYQKYSIAVKCSQKRNLSKWLVNCNILPKTVNDTNSVNKAFLLSNVSYILKQLGGCDRPVKFVATDNRFIMFYYSTHRNSIFVTRYIFCKRVGSLQ